MHVNNNSQLNTVITVHSVIKINQKKTTTTTTTKTRKERLHIVRTEKDITLGESFIE